MHADELSALGNIINTGLQKIVNFRKYNKWYPSFRLYQSKQIIFSGVVMTSVSQFGLVIGDMLN